MGKQRASTQSRTAVGAFALAFAFACGASKSPQKPRVEQARGGTGSGPGGAAGDSGRPSSQAGSDGSPASGQGGEAGIPANDAAGAAQAGAPAPADPAAGAAGAPGEGSNPWSAAVGSLCGTNDRGERWLVMTPEPRTCAERAALLASDSGEFIRAELPEAGEAELDSRVRARARSCAAGVCQDGDLELSSEPADDRTSNFGFSIDGKTVLAGALTTARCEWDRYVPTPPPEEPGVHGLALQGFAAFQAVKVPLMERGIALAPNRAGVVVGRAALFRAYVEPVSGWEARKVRAMLTLDNEGATTSLESTLTVVGASKEDALESTFDFDVSAGQIGPRTTYSLELFETSSCAAQGDRAPGRFPESGTAALGAQAVGGVSIQIVPVRIRSRTGDLLPDTSAEQLAKLRHKLLDLFPISSATVELRDIPLDSTATTALEVLDDVSALRDSEAPDRRTTYYGLFRLTETLEQYCMGTCVLGAGIVGEPAAPQGGSAVGVGYSGDTAARTFAHELGHVYGSQHSPCNTAGDPEYPYSGGRTGVWGYDPSNRALMPPSAFDFMGYCEPLWVSDYVFGRLASFIAAVNQHVELARLGPNAPFRAILVEHGTSPRVGRLHTFVEAPPGKPEQALATTSRGVTTPVLGYRSRVADAAADIVYVPDPAARDFVTVRLSSGEVIRFDPPENSPSR